MPLGMVVGSAGFETRISSAAGGLSVWTGAASPLLGVVRLDGRGAGGGLSDQEWSIAALLEVRN